MGRSLHTEMEHKRVFDLYMDKIKQFGSLSSKIARSEFYRQVAEETGYSEISVRVIMTQFLKRKHIADRRKHSKE